ncbi:MAG TPA: hypothetical protein VFG86_10170, partial [Chloroflexota bacterium]|nr:hypothetical protein [Chloroflexota bacterium]
MISRPLSRVDPAAIRALAVACGLALLLGVLVAATTPLLVGGALFGVSVVALVWWRPWTGVILFLAVVALLPFGVIPVSIGAQLT